MKQIDVFGRMVAHYNAFLSLAKSLPEMPVPQGVDLTTLPKLPNETSVKKTRTVVAKALRTETPKAAAAPVKKTRARANGDKPRFVDAIALVMVTSGQDTMKPAEIVEALSQRKWLPNSSNPQTYVSSTLSNNSDTFKRVGHGIYKVLRPARFEKLLEQYGGTEKKAVRVSSTESEPEKAEAAGDPQDSTAQALSDLGITNEGVAENPFDDAPEDAE